MPSVLDLVEKKTTDLDDLARDQDQSNLVSKKKAKKIIELSDERLTDEQEKVVRSKKSDLVDGYADKFDIDSPRQKRKHQLQKIILKELGVGSSTGEGSPYLESEIDGKERHPHGETHFESAEERIDVIRSSISTMIDNAFQKFKSYYLWESFRPKDKKEPIISIPSHIGHHADGVLLFELILPNNALDVIGARTEVIKNAVGDASNKALDQKINYTVIGNFRETEEDDPITIVESHKKREQKGMVLADIIIPRTSYPVLGAKSNPVRIEN